MDMDTTISLKDILLGRTKRGRRGRVMLWAFFLPFLFMASSFAVQGVHPFGNGMIFSVDAYHQYGPFAALVRSKILAGESLFFSWEVGLGTDFWAAFANYAASPLNILLLFFPQKYSPDILALITCIRAGLAGLFFSFLLMDTDEKKADIFTVCFSVFYALCGWSITYYWNLMWFDVVALLPLVILGLNRLVRDKKPWLYCLSLFLCLATNYFVGYFVCFFLILYVPVCYFSVYKKWTRKLAWRIGWRFSLFSALAGGMSAFLLYPTWITLQNSSATGGAFPEQNYLTQNSFDFFSRFFLGTTPNTLDGMANVYCGVMVLFLVPLFFVCKKIRMSEKVGYGLLLVFLYFSFSDRVLNYVWHGFHFPNQINCRQAFLMSFLLVFMGHKVFRNIRSFSFREIGISCTVVFLYMALYEKIGDGNETTRSILLTAGCVLLYAILFYLLIKTPKASGVISGAGKVLAAVFILEALLSTQLSIDRASFPGWDFYSKKNEEVSAFIKEKETEDGPFVRMEVYPAYICNQPALYHMKGLSVFSSTANERYVRFMKSLGFHNNGINSTRNFGLTPVSSTLLGIRYLVDLEENSPIPFAFEEVEPHDSLRIRKNPDALSLGYMVSGDVLEFTVPEVHQPFENTNAFIRSLGAPEVYIPRTMEVGTLSNLLSVDSAKNEYKFRLTESDSRASLKFEPVGYEDGESIFLYIQSSTDVTIHITETPVDESDSSQAVSRQQDATYSQIIDLGQWSADKKMQIEVVWNRGFYGDASLWLSSINEEAYEEMISVLSASQLDITFSDATVVEGVVDVKKAGVLLLTTANEPGWTAYVDGERANIQVIGEALIGLSLEEGVHTIMLSYTPKGFLPGLFISIISVTLFLFFFLIEKYIGKRKKGTILKKTIPSSTKKKAIIFDMDGTLLDTLIDLANSVNEIMKRHDFPEHTPEDYKRMIGGGAIHLIQAAVPQTIPFSKEEILALLDEFKEYYSRHDMDFTKPYDGICEMLTFFSQHNIPMAVCSNKPHEATKKLASALFPEEIFSAVFGDKDGIPRKPNPALPLMISEKFGISPKEILFVGDSGVDMETAIAAGMIPLGVAWGFRDSEELFQNGAVKIAKTPQDIIDFFLS